MEALLEFYSDRVSCFWWDYTDFWWDYTDFGGITLILVGLHRFLGDYTDFWGDYTD
jgi:hypothetical protein